MIAQAEPNSVICRASISNPPSFPMKMYIWNGMCTDA